MNDENWAVFIDGTLYHSFVWLFFISGLEGAFLILRWIPQKFAWFMELGEFGFWAVILGGHGHHDGGWSLSGYTGRPSSYGGVVDSGVFGFLS